MNIKQFRDDFLHIQKKMKRKQSEIALDSGVKQATISRFLSNTRPNLGFDSVVRLWPFVYGTEFPEPRRQP